MSDPGATDAPTAEANQLSIAALARIRSPREKRLLGLHDPFFYDG